MEKSGSLQLTTEEFALFSQLKVPPSITQKWGITSYEELKKMVDSGNYEIQEQKNLTQ